MRTLPTGYDKSLPPRVVVTLELEEHPRIEVFADSLEDEIRVRRWLGRDATRRRLTDALLDDFDELRAAA